MTTGERKQLLFQRLMAVNDERLLEDIEALLNNRCPDDVLTFLLNCVIRLIMLWNRCSVKRLCLLKKWKID